ncbi:DUF1190 domain-containing protein [Pseudomonas batumici]|uniref:Lipoprotein n=1 Tax=Pseudomonas batumici TaxID=226910 RepID=A0A0C2IEM7_9PSED|nr:DUF1190 domain-containing protein [Pseudomonas batumici]KIH85435.1 hypothetical protein UCMB321_0904 [Pseudomonas batumici]
MRTRSCVTLVLAGTLPLALSACGASQDSVEVTSKSNFKSVEECVGAKVPVEVCSDAFMQALADHRRIAPTYDDQASCDSDFVPGYCQVTPDGKYMPKMGGFELAMSGEVPRKDLEQAQQQAATQSGGNSGGGGNGGLLTGLLLGNLLSNSGGGGRYYSQPIYDSRDDRGSYTSSTLSRQIEQGKSFSRSTQARSSSTNTYTPTTLGKSLGSGSGSVSSTVSRGGFGSQATARSGWGGKSSSSFFSSGG